jgi:hypothetical protein
LASEKIRLSATGLGGSGGLADDALPQGVIVPVLWSTTRRITTMFTKNRRFLPVALLLALLSSWSMPSVAYDSTELYIFMRIRNGWLPAPKFSIQLYPYILANFQRTNNNGLLSEYNNALGLYFQYNITTFYVRAITSGASPAQLQVVSTALTQIQTLNSKSPN